MVCPAATSPCQAIRPYPSLAAAFQSGTPWVAVMVSAASCTAAVRGKVSVISAVVVKVPWFVTSSA